MQPVITAIVINKEDVDEYNDTLEKLREIAKRSINSKTWSFVDIQPVTAEIGGALLITEFEFLEKVEKRKLADKLKASKVLK